MSDGSAKVHALTRSPSPRAVRQIGRSSATERRIGASPVAPSTTTAGPQAQRGTVATAIGTDDASTVRKARFRVGQRNLTRNGIGAWAA